MNLFSEIRGIKPINLPERLVWYSIVLTHLFWLLGATYIVGSILGWILFSFVIIRLVAQDEGTANADYIRLHPIIYIWIACMLMLEVALIAGHIDYNLPTSLVLKSSIGWAKGFGAMAIYLISGSLKIRFKLLVRAVTIVCIISLLVSPFLVASLYLPIPNHLYTSPLKVLGGSGEEFFSVMLYEFEPGTTSARFRFFSPWAPAIGMLSNLYLVLIIHERSHLLRFLGISGCIAMILLSKSRLAQMLLVATPFIVYLVFNYRKPVVLFGLGALTSFGGLISSSLLVAFEDFYIKFKSARADSSRIRDSLKNIAFDRWHKEAPIWGHGVVERGPHLVEYMPIGTHHFWAGLAFIKGAVGMAAMAIALLATLAVFILRSLSNRYELAKYGLLIMIVIWVWTFAENLEGLVYLFWPVMLALGICLKSLLKNPAIPARMGQPSIP